MKSLPCHSRRPLQLLSFLNKSAEGAEPDTKAVLEASPLYALLIPDLATNVGAGPQVERRDEEGEPTEAATVSNGLCVLAKDIARTEIGDDASCAVIEATTEPVSPLARHFFRDTLAYCRSSLVSCSFLDRSFEHHTPQ